MIQYVVLVGEEVKIATPQYEQALQVYESLPNGTGKPARLRRSLVKEETLKEDKR